MLVARAHGALGNCGGVLDVLAAAEHACSCSSSDDRRTGVVKKSDLIRRGSTGMNDASPSRPPAELYEVVARSLAMNGQWEEAASAVRSLEVSKREKEAFSLSFALGWGFHVLIIGKI